jgi:hypothetical protein
MTMPAFVNDGCNPLLMMVVTIAKMYYFFRWFQYAN